MLYWTWETSGLKVFIRMCAQIPLLPEKPENNTDMLIDLEKLLTSTSRKCAWQQCCIYILL